MKAWPGGRGSNEEETVMMMAGERTDLNGVGFIGPSIDFGDELVQGFLHGCSALGAQASHAKLRLALKVEVETAIQMEQVHSVPCCLKQIEPFAPRMSNHHRHMVPLERTGDETRPRPSMILSSKSKRDNKLPGFEWPAWRRGRPTEDSGTVRRLPAPAEAAPTRKARRATSAGRMQGSAICGSKSTTVKKESGVCAVFTTERKEGK